MCQVSGSVASPVAVSRSGSWWRVASALLAGFALGGLTFVAQGVLPDAVESLANSASGWTLLTVLLVGWARQPPAWSAVVAAASFVLLVVGYSAAAMLQGLFYDPALFGTIGVLVGPFVGVATAWLRVGSSLQAAAGTALLVGIALGEAVYGLTVVATTTSPVYWIGIGLCGLALLGGMLARRVRTAAGIATAVAGAAIVAAMFLGAYLGMNSLL